MKDFDSWNLKKQEIDRKAYFFHPKVGEIWWCMIGMNIGSEIYGKGKNYLRPGLVIELGQHDNFIGIPLTSKKKKSRRSCIIRSEDGILHTALITQLRCFDKRRLLEKKSALSNDEFTLIKNCLRSVLKI